MSIRIGAVVALLAVSWLHAVGQTVNVVGKWKGVVVVSPPRDKNGKAIGGPPPSPNITYTLNLNANGKFSTLATLPDGKKTTSDGTWKLAGRKLTLTITHRDGKPNKEEPKTRILTIAEDGKTMTTPLQAQIALRNEKGETREIPNGITPPKITLLFKRA